LKGERIDAEFLDIIARYVARNCAPKEDGHP
jgi:hypothetical protein